jgi:hypothetical protein
MNLVALFMERSKNCNVSSEVRYAMLDCHQAQVFLLFQDLNNLLKLAMKSRNLRFCKVLLDQGADPNTANEVRTFRAINLQMFVAF